MQRTRVDAAAGEYGEVPFDAVLDDELAAIRERRRALGVTRGHFKSRPDESVESRAWDMRLLGLAYSGGGIRSATFNLGILQTLAAFGLLKHVDYLSTVSGGGYIGNWLTALAQRTFVHSRQNGEAASAAQPGRNFDREGYEGFERELSWTAGDAHDTAAGVAGGREHEAIRFLREFSNYLTPKLGMFSGDTWALLSIYLRNALLNQLVLVFALAAAVLCIPHLLSIVSKAIGRADIDNPWGLGVCVVIFATGFILVCWNLGRNLAGIADYDRKAPNADSSPGVIGWILLPLLLIAATVPNWLPAVIEIVDERWASSANRQLVAALIGAVVSFLTWGGSALAARAAPWRPTRSFWKSIVAWSFVSGALFGVGMYWAGKMLANVVYVGSQLVIAPPLFALGILTAGVLHIGLAGAGFGPQYSEWLSRLGGLMLVGAVGWLGVTGLLLISPLLVDLVAESVIATSVLSLGWVLTTASAVLTGKKSGSIPTGSIPNGSLPKRVLRLVAPWVFIVGLLVILAAGINAVLHRVQAFGASPPVTDYACVAKANYDEAITVADAKARYEVCLTSFIASVFGAESEEQGPTVPAEELETSRPMLLLSHYLRWLDVTEDVRYVLALIFLAAFFTWLLSRRIDINSFSLHNMYANRLVRCYLGASVHNRWGNPFSGFSAADDLKLCAVATPDSRVFTHFGADVPKDRLPKAGAPNGVAYPGPYPIINTAINLVAGSNLAWQERKAASFVLTPFYCGYRRAGDRNDPDGEGACDAYRPSREFSSDTRNLTLGEAMATSGAAASPNMGYHSSSAFAFLMGVFNIRLGRWVGNPYTRRAEKKLSSWRLTLRERSGFAESWKHSGPGFALWHLLREVFGLTDSENRFVYLSDGGHFENLGIYELVRRRCRYIVACDSGADPGCHFEDLANAIRKCRIDLGVEIDIDVKEIATIDAERNHSAPCAVGRIRYSSEQVGTLIYIKASRFRGFPSDVRHYASVHATFPHETTADQFFSESQFESYRRLGYFLGTRVFGDAIEDIAGDATGNYIDGLFHRLHQNWYPSSVSVDENFTRLGATVDELFERLRQSHDNLGFLARQFYPEWRSLVKNEVVVSSEEAAAAWDLPETEAELREGFYFCSSLLQLMENAYLDLDFESEWQHPDNSGWLNLFRHWTWSSMFRVTWTIIAATYGGRFRAFCRQRLGLELGAVGVRALVGDGERRNLEAILQSSGLNLLERRHVKDLLKDLASFDRVQLFELELHVETPFADAPGLDAHLRSFVFGYAVVVDGELLMFRVQDHLRNMELGRNGLTALVRYQIANERPIALSASNEEILARLDIIGEPALPGQIAEFKNALETIKEDHGLM
jgi:hypothetical protein